MRLIQAMEQRAMWAWLRMKRCWEIVVGDFRAVDPMSHMTRSTFDDMGPLSMVCGRWSHDSFNYKKRVSMAGLLKKNIFFRLQFFEIITFPLGKFIIKNSICSIL